MKSPSPATRQLRLALPRNNESSFGEYLPGPNLEPWENLRQMAAGRVRNNLHLWGDAGTGKSHLLRALCLESPPGMARWLEEAPEGLEDRPECDFTCVDNLERLASQPQREQGFLALYDLIRARGGILLTASRKPPQQIPLRLPDLRSRLAWGLVFRLRPLPESELPKLLRRRARGRGLHLPEAAALYLLHRAPRDPSSLCALIDHLEQSVPPGKRSLDIPFLRQHLDGNGAGDDS